MMHLLTSPEAWAALLTLTALEIVLGIDNVIFLSVIVSRIPEKQAHRARQIGLALALIFRIILLSLLVWLIGLTAPVFSFSGYGFSWRDLILIGGGLFLLFRFMSARRDAQPAYATAGAPYAGGGYGGGGVQDVTVPEPSAVASDLDRGLAHIRSMDSTFDPGVVSDAARGLFGDVQRALTARDMSPVSARVTSRMYTELTSQCDRLRAARQSNRMEGINVRRSEVTEAWQESGQDFVTVYLAGSLVDYTVDDTTGALVDGAKTPQEFEEFWTFTRPVGPNPWRLSAIQSA